MTLRPYGLGMTGNRDETGRTGPEGADWARGRVALLRDLIDETIAAISQDVPVDVTGADKRARAVTNVARAIKAVESIFAHPDVENPEDEMSNQRDDDPQVVAQLRAELAGRLDRLHAIVEQKRADRRARDGGATEGGPEAGPEDGGASGPAGAGVADLGDAGRTGGGKDVCGGLLAA